MKSGVFAGHSQPLRRSIAVTSIAAGLLALLLLCAGSSEFAIADTGPLQSVGARQSISLNGAWQTIVDPYENGFYSHRYEEKPNGYFLNRHATAPGDLVEYDFSRSPQLQVPGDWNSQDERLWLYEGTVWYQRDFSLELRADRRYLLHFGAVNYQAVVYVNGSKAGVHEGGFTPFQFDVSTLLHDGSNSIVVKVDNRRETDNVPTMNTDWWNYGGITRPVRLLVLARSYVANYAIHLDPQHPELISGWIQLGGDAVTTGRRAKLALPELGVERSVPLDASGYGKFKFPADAQRWSPRRPKLYTLSIHYAGQLIEDQVGLRTIGVAGDNILLNGEPIYLRGISIHEEAPDRPGRAWSEADAMTTLGWARELGCNFVRLAHYPHNEAMVRAADRLGLLVWSEIPVYWTIDFASSSVYAKAEQQLEEMITRDQNRAAVILWSVANETPNDAVRLEFLSRLVTRARQLDSTRLLTAASDTQVSSGGVVTINDPLTAVVDVIGVNSYCGWYGGIPEECARLRWASPSGKPVIVSEFGAGALQGRHGTAGDRWSEEYQAAVYRNNLVMLDDMPFVRGTTPWILKDFRSPRRPLPGVQDFWNRKGLLSETGTRKQAWQLLHDFYRDKEESTAR